jgi:hypothetical protein
MQTAQFAPGSDAGWIYDIGVSDCPEQIRREAHGDHTIPLQGWGAAGIHSLNKETLAFQTDKSVEIPRVVLLAVSMRKWTSYLMV